MTTTDIAGYYDGFVDRLVDDYENGNPRVDMAIAFALDALSDCKLVLDVGCGIGWTSAVLVSHGKAVLGIDISPALVETADRMFSGPKCGFVTRDFASFGPPGFDAVLMVDVYEHFPRDTRPAVYKSLRQISARKVALTMPTPATQQYARDHGIPLQIVDEDVTDDDIDELADAIGGTVAVNRTVTVWRPDDYRHVLIER